MKRLLTSFDKGITIALILLALAFVFLVWALNPILWIVPPLRRKLRNLAGFVVEAIFCGGGREW